ncbi:MAG: helix-turn-helix domain-containing protein [Flavobacteriaceae bacterium]|jgi:AraC-like DNA-binding protein|nr:helix-turn-helix domain-containing protein [Flavobacteriaceae bacterium]
MVVEAHIEEQGREHVLKNRSSTVIDEFYALVSKYAVEQKDITFYADKLNLTAAYLTTLLTQKTGKSALKWIDHVVILHAKSLLKTTDLSVKEISNCLNFNDSSLFCRYFKRHTSLSPNSFRRQ